MMSRRKPRETHMNNNNNNNNNIENKVSKKLDQHLSNERTFLSWTRTGLNIFTVGCAIGRFGGSNANSGATLTSSNSQKKPLIAGIVLAIIGIICEFYGIWRYYRTHRRIKHGHRVSGPKMIGPIFSVLILVAALTAILIIFFII